MYRGGIDFIDKDNEVLSMELIGREPSKIGMKDIKTSKTIPIPI